MRRLLTTFAAFLTLFLPSPDPSWAQPQRPEDPDGMAERVRACTSCHGDQGRASSQGYLPRIAGKPAGYLYNQLISFREDQRHYPLMKGLLNHLDDAYLREMAEHFAGLDLPYPAPQLAGADAALLKQGEDLVRRGDPARGIPACANCHGSRLTGVQPAIPGLLGLPRDYLNAQLGAWKTGQRRSAKPDCMATIAKQLTPADVSAVSTWLASQRVPSPSGPSREPANAQATECGVLASQSAHPIPGVPIATTRVAGPGNTLGQGEYLARAGNCIACHTAPGGKAFAGGRALHTPFGTVYSGNLTPDRATGLGAWNREDFWRAMHEGRSRDGRLLNPAFPYQNYTRLTRTDSDALFDYLQSLPAVLSPNRTHDLRFPFGTPWAIAIWRSLYFSPQPPIQDATRSPNWNRGAYLVNTLGHCDACHAPRNFLGATRNGQALAGGQVAKSRWYAPSLASADEASMRDWPIDEIVRFLRTGQSSRGSAIGPMAEVVYRSTQHLNDADLQSMALYLKELPLTAASPISKVAPAMPSPRGARLYRDHCADCHGTDGQGRPGVYPALAGNRTVTMASAGNLIAIVLEGGYPPATRGNPRPHGMPPFGHVLDDESIASVLNHVRSAWGHTASPVSGQMVQRGRGAP